MDLLTLLANKPKRNENWNKVILDLCGGSGSWSKPYLDAGYDVRLLTLPNDIRLIETFESYSGFNIHGILAAPPCTVFANSGVQWFRSREEMLEGISILDACIRFIHVLNPVFWALENPIGKVTRFLGPPTYKFDPCDHGDGYTKKTYLWRKFNLPIRNPVPISSVPNPIHNASPGKDRASLRSITPPGFAKAFFESNR